MQTKDIINKDIDILKGGQGATTSEVKYSSSAILVESKEHSFVS